MTKTQEQKIEILEAKIAAIRAVWPEVRSKINTPAARIIDELLKP